MSTHIELKLRCDSKAHFEAWLDAQGLMQDSIDEDGKPTRVPVSGVQIAELGPITQVPAVLGPDFTVITPAVVDTAYHVDVRFYSPNLYERDTWTRNGKQPPVLAEDFYETITKNIAQTEVVVVDGKDVTVAKDAIDCVSITADIKAATEVVSETKDGVKVAPGYYDAVSGVAIVTPATPRHTWC